MKQCPITGRACANTGCSANLFPCVLEPPSITSDHTDVARIKQPEGATIYNHPIYGASVGTGSYNRDERSLKIDSQNKVKEVLPSLNAEQEKKEGMSKYSNSEIGSHHWAATLLSFIMRVGEYLETHENNPSETIHYREWGTHMKQRAVEVNNYLQSLPDKPERSIKKESRRPLVK